MTSDRSHRSNLTFTASYAISIYRERCYGWQFIRRYDMPSRQRSWKVSTDV